MGDMSDYNSLKLKLVELVESTGYSLVQNNGQRRFGPKPGAEVPPRGTEVFVGKIPRDCFEDELVPLFAEVGEIYEMRLMMDFSGSNRGFAFVTYTEQSMAQKAISTLNDKTIWVGRRRLHLKVKHSVDNRRLYIGCIKRTATVGDLKKLLEQLTTGIVDITMYRDATNPSLNRGYAFVEFASHSVASTARRQLVGQLHLDGKPLRVDWAEPENFVPSNIMEQVRILHVRNLSSLTTEQHLMSAVNQLGVATERVCKMSDYAFVHLRSRKDTEYVLEKLNGYRLHGRKLEVKLAKPVLKDEAKTKKTNNNADHSLKEMLRMYRQHEKEFECVQEHGVASGSTTAVTGSDKIADKRTASAQKKTSPDAVVEVGASSSSGLHRSPPTSRDISPVSLDLVTSTPPAISGLTQEQLLSIYVQNNYEPLYIDEMEGSHYRSTLLMPCHEPRFPPSLLVFRSLEAHATRQQAHVAVMHRVFGAMQWMRAPAPALPIYLSQHQSVPGLIRPFYRNVGQ